MKQNTSTGKTKPAEISPNLFHLTVLNVWFICQSVDVDSFFQLVPAPPASPSECPTPRRPARPFHRHESFMLSKTALIYAGTNLVDRPFPSSSSSCWGNGFISTPGTTLHPLSICLSVCLPLWQPDPLCVSSSAFCLYLYAAASFILYLISRVFPFSLLLRLASISDRHARPDHTQDKLQSTQTTNRRNAVFFNTFTHTILC